MNENKELDKTLEHAFEQAGEAPPEDRYFEKIWNSIEVKAPVGEKYYLRFAFSILFFMLFCMVFVFFYSEFLSSVLTLKEIRKENALFFSSSVMPLVPRVHTPEAVLKSPLPIADDILVEEIDNAKVRVLTREAQTIELEFLSGHAIIKKHDGPHHLTILLPDVRVNIKRGNCNIYCYDGMVRIIPLNLPIEVETPSGRETVPLGKIFYLLNKKPLII